MNPEVTRPAAAARYEILCLALLLAGLAGALVREAWVTGVAIDGPSHLLSAHLYWRGADTLKPGDMPPLIKIVGGWVPGLFRLPIPYDHPVWAEQHEWYISGEMLARMSGPEIQRLFFFSRLPLLVFPLLTALLVWHWGRQLFGPWTGVLLALAFALEPSALGHGALFKNDLAATCTYFFFWYRAWRFWRDARPRNVVWLGVALLLAMLSKMSMLFLAPLAPAVVILRYATLRERRLRPAALALLVVLLLPYLGSLAAYQFDTRRLPAEELAALAVDPEVPRSLVWAGQIFRVLPLPARMWAGTISLFREDAGGNLAYFLGRIHARGHPLYFVIALAVKVPVPLQILFLCGAVMTLLRFKRRQLEVANAFWLVPPALYIGLASLSSLQLGVRLVLPALPFALLLCGAPVAAWIRSRKVAIVAGLFAWLMLRSVEVYPHGISYFNLWAGGPEHGLRYLADSNLDWGQDLPELAKFFRDRGLRRIHLSYFGRDNPWRYFREGEIEIVVPPWGPEWAQGTVYEPQPGFYAVSATLLPGHLFAKEYRDYYKVFRGMEPLAKAGYSIFIYHVP